MFEHIKNSNFISFFFLTNYYFASSFALLLNYEGSAISIAIKAILVLFFLSSFLIKNSRSKFSRIQFAFIFILILYSLRLIYDFQLVGLKSSLGNYNYYINVVFLGILPLYSLSNFCNDDKVNIYILLIFVVAIFINIYFAITQIDISYSGRLANIKLNPISMGNLAAIGIYLFISRVIKIPSIFIVVFFIFFAVIIFFTQSRGNQLALLFTIISSSIFRYSFKKSFWGFVAISLFGLVLIYVTNFDFEIFDYVSKIGSEKDLSGTYRLDIINESYLDITNNLLFGNSVLTPDGGYHHNIFIELASSIGIISLFFFLIVIYVIVKLYRNIYNFNNFDYFIFLSVIHGLVLSNFSSSFSEIGSLLFLSTNLYHKYVKRINLV